MSAKSSDNARHVKVSGVFPADLKTVQVDRITIAELLPGGYSPNNIWCFGLSGKESSENLASYGTEVSHVASLLTASIKN